MIKFFLDIVEHKRQRSAAMLKRNSDRNMVQVERQFSSFCRKNIGKKRLCFERIKEVPRFASRLPWDKCLLSNMVGEHVKITQIIGIEGNTGHSFGSHLHYCCRNNASKSEIRNICTISGIPNKLGTYDDGYKAGHSTVHAAPAKKSNEEIAKEVIKGKWGKGADRKQRLTAAGYNPSEIQKIVNRLMK